LKKNKKGVVKIALDRHFVEAVEAVEAVQKHHTNDPIVLTIFFPN
jgi:hypothetical protein